MNYEKIVTLYDTARHARGLPGAIWKPRAFHRATLAPSTRGLLLCRRQTRGCGFMAASFRTGCASVRSRRIRPDRGKRGSRVDGSRPGNRCTESHPDLKCARSGGSAKRAQQQGLIANTAQSTAAAVPPPAAVMAAGRQMPGEEVLRLAEEQFDVGKRVISDGATRIRRFVTVTPVEAPVTLHEEHTRVIRRASTDPNFLRDVDWTDKTIEVAETAEEPVVTKSVHIAEEVVIRKKAPIQSRLSAMPFAGSRWKWKRCPAERLVPINVDI